MVVALILFLAHIDIDLSGQLTAGDVVVGVGTLLLAIFTWRLAGSTSRLADDTVELARRTALRERRRRDQQIRGIARLVDGELAIVKRSITSALERRTWRIGMPMPRGAWDREGSLITATIPEDQALALIRLFSDLAIWNLMERTMNGPDIDAEPASTIARRLANILAQVEVVRRDLHPLAYPDHSDLEPDPDA